MPDIPLSNRLAVEELTMPEEGPVGRSSLAGVHRAANG